MQTSQSDLAVIMW